MCTGLISVYARNLKAANKSERTIQTYCSNIAAAERYVQKNFSLSFTSEDADKINGQMIKDWLMTLDQYSENSRLLAFASMRSFIKDMISSGYFPMSMADTVPKIKRRPTGDEVLEEDDEEDESSSSKEYTPEQVLALINYVGNTKANFVRDQAIITLLFATGLRCSETCSLTVGTIRRMRNGAIRVRRKGGVVKKVEVADFALPYIEKYLKERGDCEDSDPLFLGRNGLAITKRGLEDMLRRKQLALGLRTGVHNTRHTFLSDIGRRTNPIVARDAAGHSSVSITNTYLHNTSKDLHTAVSESPWAVALSNRGGDI